MFIAKDENINKWVVWLKKGSACFEVFHSKTKKECQEYLNKSTKRSKND